MTEPPYSAPAAPPLPAWVGRVKTIPRSPIGRAARAVRRLHRTLTIAAVIALPPANAWAWLGPEGGAAFALRALFAVALLAVLPILILRWADPPTSAFIRRARRSHPAIRRTPVPLGRIAKPMQLAALVTEDTYFFWHIGFNPVEIWNAFRYNQRVRQPGLRRRGGSTITQQLAKNLFLSPSQSYLRKALEVPLTLLIEGLWPKRRILEVYLNVVEFGPGIFGVEAAARQYFARPAADLDEAEAALLATALRAPHIYDLAEPSPRMREVQADTLQRMHWCGEEMLSQLERP